MAKGVASIVVGKHGDHRRGVLIGAGALVAVVLIIAALQIFLPSGIRACALMPGFCKKDQSSNKTPFQQLDEGYHGGAKFGLTTSR